MFSVSPTIYWTNGNSIYNPEKIELANAKIDLSKILEFHGKPPAQYDEEE
ncbi:MAG: hypothetical protein HC836_21845 [Richelia sp. RM2_1_2]|nr:hypothetical protein [Richelia sp. SM2_1_7]NJM22561.1 hypothetical protein [Richelia sp. SM1_7_0]NJO60802.1 hypothetical protein [Richelia sp. RM2_1_2]